MSTKLEIKDLKEYCYFASSNEDEAETAIRGGRESMMTYLRSKGIVLIDDEEVGKALTKAFSKMVKGKIQK